MDAKSFYSTDAIQELDRVSTKLYPVSYQQAWFQACFKIQIPRLPSAGA